MEFQWNGIILTHGNPRSHIWSCICGNQESSGCPCSIHPRAAPPFVGNDNFCESGAPYPTQTQFYTNDLLWDGKGCGSSERQCCWPPDLPWFHKTTDTLPLR